jgi:hypothetical protein
MKIWERGSIAAPFFASALDGGEWSPSHSGHINPGDTASSTHYVGGWMGLTAGLEVSEN